MEQYTYDVFISYRRKGGSEKAQLIKSELKQRGINEGRIFLDTHSLHDGDFEQKIKVAIQQSKSVVVVISNRCFDEIKETDFWYLEIKEALQLGKIVVPVFFDGITSFANENVPQELQELTKKNAVTYHHEYANAAFDKVLVFIGCENGHNALKPRTKGCLFSFKYKGCLLSVTLIALLVFVIVPITLLHFVASSPSSSNDDICYSNVDEDVYAGSAAPPKEDVPSFKDRPVVASARPNNDSLEIKLLGKWEGTSENKNMVCFWFDSNCVLKEEGYDSSRIKYNHGIYHVKGGKLFFEWSKSESQIARYKLTDGKLILSFSEGQTMILTKTSSK